MMRVGQLRVGAACSEPLRRNAPAQIADQARAKRDRRKRHVQRTQEPMPADPASPLHQRVIPPPGSNFAMVTRDWTVRILPMAVLVIKRGTG